MEYLPFLVLLGVLLFILGGIVAELAYNANQPIESRSAKNVKKHSERELVQVAPFRYFYSYSVVFRFETGNNKQFCVSQREYKTLAEGEEGLLTYQGTRYIQFSQTLKYRRCE